MPRKDATCIQTHSRRPPQICREQANTVLCFTFICFSFPIRTYQNNTITLGNAQLCRTQRVERSELCQAAAWGILRYWRKTLQRFILGLQNTANDMKHDIVKQKFDVGLVRCEVILSGMFKLLR